MFALGYRLLSPSYRLHSWWCPSVNSFPLATPFLLTANISIASRVGVHGGAILRPQSTGQGLLVTLALSSQTAAAASVKKPLPPARVWSPRSKQTSSSRGLSISDKHIYITAGTLGQLSLGWAASTLVRQAYNFASFQA